jgi:hypothetical protein
MGRVAKGVSCSVRECNGQAAVSVAAASVKPYLSLSDTSARRAYLCKAHYKDYKRLSRRDRDLERARYGP